MGDPKEEGDWKEERDYQGKIRGKREGEKKGQKRGGSEEGAEMIGVWGTEMAMESLFGGRWYTSLDDQMDDTNAMETVKWWLIHSDLGSIKLWTL